jgi:hypothetical protein
MDLSIILLVGVSPTEMLIDFLPCCAALPRLAAAEGLYLFGIKKTSRASLNTIKKNKTSEKKKRCMRRNLM